VRLLYLAVFITGGALISFGQTPTPATTSDAFQLGHGLNLFNLIEFMNEDETARHGLKDGDFVNIRQAGFNLLRAPIHWSKHVGPAPDFIIDPAFFKRIDWIVAEAAKYHFQLVLDYHDDDALMEDPAANTLRYLATWKQIAAHFKDALPSVLFELMNEPHKKLNGEAWNALFPQALALVRVNNPTRGVIIGPTHFDAIKDLADLVLPENDPHIIVTVHYYDPMKFTHQGSWFPGSKAWLGTTWGTEEEKRRVIDDFGIAAAWGKAHHRPIYLGEFGSSMKGDMESRARWTGQIVQATKAQGIPWTYWDYCRNFGVYDPTAKQWRQPLLDALLQK
jgi:endoglucanase